MIFSEKCPDRAICQRPDGMWTLYEVYDGYGAPCGTVFHEAVAREYLDGVEPSLLVVWRNRDQARALRSS